MDNFPTFVIDVRFIGLASWAVARHPHHHDLTTATSITKTIAFPRSNFEAAQPPILIDNGVAVLENEKIERHIMKNIPGGHNLFISDNVR